MIAAPHPSDTRVLVVHGDAAAADGLRDALEVAGHRVAIATGGRDALHTLAGAPPSALLLALELPDMDGLLLLRALRQRHARLPVLVLAARDGEADTVRAFRYGADGYLVPPFGRLELLARLEALLRRAAAARAPRRPPPPPPSAAREPDFVIGDVELFVAQREVRKAGRPVALTYKEFELLVALARRHGAVVTREELLATVWGGPGQPVEARTIDTYIRGLRRKLEDRPGKPRRILTVWKVGYRVEM